MKKKCILMLSVGLSFLMFALLAVLSGVLKGKLEAQQMAQRWSEDGGVAQVSCFFSVNARITEAALEEFAHSVDTKLQEASIVSESSNANARMWADAYSANGQITVQSERGSVTVDALGIGGDFFLFHPLQLLSGSYFSGNDLMQDYCLLDQEAAWKLFGSNDIAGQVVYIGGRAHIVSGVIKHEEGKLYEAAGLDASQIYVSYETLATYGINNGINHYEIVMPNPVEGFAMGCVENGISVGETEREFVENSSRFSLWNCVKHIGKLATRSMNGKAIIYPYWENVARAYEDILALFMFFELLFVLYPVIIIAGALRFWWKHRNWTVKSLLLRLRGGRKR